MMPDEAVSFGENFAYLFRKRIAIYRNDNRQREVVKELDQLKINFDARGKKDLSAAVVSLQAGYKALLALRSVTDPKKQDMISDEADRLLSRSLENAKSAFSEASSYNDKIDATRLQVLAILSRKNRLAPENLKKELLKAAVGILKDEKTFSNFEKFTNSPRFDSSMSVILGSSAQAIQRYKSICDFQVIRRSLLDVVGECPAIKYKQMNFEPLLSNVKDFSSFSSGHTKPNVFAVECYGQCLYSGGDDCAIVVWDLTTEVPVVLQRLFDFKTKVTVNGAFDDKISRPSVVAKCCYHVGPVTAIKCFGRYMYSSSLDGTVLMWDISGSSAQCRYRLIGNRKESFPWGSDNASAARASPALCLAVCDRGASWPPLLFVGTDDGSIAVWSIPVQGEDGWPLCVQVIPPHDVGSNTYEYKGHVGGVTALAVYNDCLYSGGKDGNLFVWGLLSRLGGGGDPSSSSSSSLSNPLKPVVRGQLKLIKKVLNQRGPVDVYRGEITSIAVAVDGSNSSLLVGFLGRFKEYFSVGDRVRMRGTDLVQTTDNGSVIAYILGFYFREGSRAHALDIAEAILTSPVVQGEVVAVNDGYSYDVSVTVPLPAAVGASWTGTAYGVPGHIINLNTKGIGANSPTAITKDGAAFGANSGADSSSSSGGGSGGSNSMVMNEPMRVISGIVSDAVDSVTQSLYSATTSASSAATNAAAAASSQLAMTAVSPFSEGQAVESNFYPLNEENTNGFPRTQPCAPSPNESYIAGVITKVNGDGTYEITFDADYVVYFYEDETKGVAVRTVVSNVPEGFIRPSTGSGKGSKASKSSSLSTTLWSYELSEFLSRSSLPQPDGDVDDDGGLRPLRLHDGAVTSCLMIRGRLYAASYDKTVSVSEIVKYEDRSSDYFDAIEFRRVGDILGFSGGVHCLAEAGGRLFAGTTDGIAERILRLTPGEDETNYSADSLPFRRVDHYQFLRQKGIIWKPRQPPQPTVTQLAKAGSTFDLGLGMTSPGADPDISDTGSVVDMVISGGADIMSSSLQLGQSFLTNLLTCNIDTSVDDVKLNAGAKGGDLAAGVSAGGRSPGDDSDSNGCCSRVTGTKCALPPASGGTPETVAMER